MLDYLYNEYIFSWELSYRDLSIKSWLLPLFFALISGHYKSEDHRHLLAFIGYSLLMEHVSGNKALQHLFHENTNSAWYHLLTPGLFFLMTRLFSGYISRSKYNWIQWALPAVFTLIAIWNMVWGDGFNMFPSITVGIYSITGIVLALGYFIDLLRRSEVFFLEREPMFWIGAGLLVYYSGNFLIWIGFSFLTYEAIFFDSIYKISRVLTILLNFTFVIAILLDNRYYTYKPKKLTT